MSTIYVHIGTHKTGTTAIQQFLFTNEDTLIEKGFLYPRSGRSQLYKLAQHKLAWSIRSDRTYNPKTNKWEKIDQEWNKLHLEISAKKPNNIIISAEYFSTFDIEDIKLLKQKLSNYKVKIIVYLRRQDSFLESLYLQSIKNGFCCKNINSFIEERQWRCDYYKLLQSWKQSFGKDNLIVRVYEKEQYGNGLIDDFLSSIGLKNDDDFLNQTTLINQTKDIKLIKFIRLSNFILEKINIPQKTRAMINSELWLSPYTKRRKIFRKIFLIISDYLINEKLLSVQDKIKIINKFSEANQKVAQEYLERPDGRLFYSALPQGKHI